MDFCTIIFILRITRLDKQTYCLIRYTLNSDRYLHLDKVPYESFIMESQMTRNRQNGEIQIAGFAPTRLIISVFRLLIGQLK